MNGPVMDNWYHVAGNEIHVSIKAIPHASKTEFAGVRDGCLRVRVAAVPEEGKANAVLIAFIAKAIGCPRRELTLLRGEKSRYKIFTLPLMYEAQLQKVAGISGLQA